MTASHLLAWSLAAAWQAGLAGLVLLALAARCHSHGVRRVLLGGGTIKFLVPVSLTAPFAALNLFENVATPPVPSAAPGLAVVAAVLLGIWAGGAALMLLRLSISSLLLRGEMRDAERVEGGPLLAEARAAADRIGLKRLPEIYLVGDRASGPRACGIFRPAVLLPAGLGEWVSGPALQAVITHELAHHRRRDLLLLATADLVVAIWWFHPVAWMLQARLRHAVEDGCDELVLDHGTAVTPEQYCTALLEVARFCVGGGSPAVAAGFAAHALRRRLRRALSAPKASGGRLGLGFALLVVLALLPGAPRGIVAGEREVVREVRVVVRIPGVEVVRAHSSGSEQRKVRR
ncbi:MAG TPA: M56 family metallopeptidase [Longimicrobiaceae bacterium]|nr:M56 family metallopeptidase [Longimicrobiaceae bacterium]